MHLARRDSGVRQGVGFIAVATTDNLVIGSIGICIATIGFWTSNTVGWTLSPKYLSGAALASGLALVNSVGNLGGFFGPFIIGWLRQISGGYRLSLGFLAVILAVNGLIVVGLQFFDQRQRSRSLPVRQSDEVLLMATHKMPRAGGLADHGIVEEAGEIVDRGGYSMRRHRPVGMVSRSGWRG